MPRWRDAFRSAAPLALVSLLVTRLRLAGELRGWTAYFGAAFIPQLVFWVAFTVVTGMLAGTVVAALRPARGGSQ